MAIRCSRVFAQTGDQFRDPAAPLLKGGADRSHGVRRLGSLGDSGLRSGYGIG
jgi:hypothetical protein